MKKYKNKNWWTDKSIAERSLIGIVLILALSLTVILVGLLFKIVVLDVLSGIILISIIFLEIFATVLLLKEDAE